MARRYALIAALLAAVLLGHALLLQWLAWQAVEGSALPLMAAPMYTRMLQPEAPPAPPVAKAAPAARRRPAPALRTIEAPAQPEAAAPDAPEPVPEPVASEPPTETPTVAISPDPQPDPLPSPSLSPTATSSVPGTDTVTLTLDGWPIDTRLTYRLSGYYRGDLHGNAKVEWLRDGERYQVRIDIDLGLLSMAMTSQGQVRDHELAPAVYEESRIGKRRSVLIQDKIVLDNGSQVPRPDGVQDTASQFVELSHRFKTGQLPLEVGRSVTLWMARPGGVDQWTYDVADKEVLQTPQLGAVEAFHLKPRRLVDPRGNVTAEMWFAPTLQYLPVRIVVLSGEAKVDLLVDKIEQR